jgi:hypothetical protein
MRLKCDCGQDLEADNSLIGKRVKCPGCGKAVLVRGRPVEADNGTPEPRARKKSGLAIWLLLGGSALLLSCMCLVGGGVGAYFLFFRKTSEPYEVKFQVPFKEADVYEIDATAESSGKVVQTGAAPQTKELAKKVSLRAKVKVLAVDSKGRETRSEVTISSLTLKDGNLDSSPLPPNAVVLREVQPNGSVSYRQQNGAALPPQALDALQDSLGKNSRREDDPDESYGTSEKKRIGDSWPINKSFVVKGFKENLLGKPIDESKVSGTTTLANSVQEGGVTYLELRIDINIDLQDQMQKNGANAKSTGHVKYHVTYRVPADYSTGPVSVSARVEFKGDADLVGPKGAMQISADTAQIKNTSIKYLLGAAKAR